MEALRDRTVKVDIPYITKVSEEVRIYAKDFSDRPKIKSKHVAPHTLYVAALWAVHDAARGSQEAQRCRLMQKMRSCTTARRCPGFTQDNGQGAPQGEPSARASTASAPRYIQDKIANALVNGRRRTATINPFMVLNELEKRPAPRTR